MKKMKTKNSEGFSGRSQKFKIFFSCRKQVISKKKERSSSQNYQEIRCQSTKIPLANTNLGLYLHSSSPEPDNFFGAQSSLGGHNFRLGGGTSSHLGGTAPEYPPVAQGLLCYIFRKLSSKHTKLKLENHSSVSI